MDLAVMDAGINRADLEREALGDRIKAAMAEGVAAQQAPGSEQYAAGGAEAAH